MNRKPKTEEDDGGGLDSLLDTMTNVVGILVMVLIATQLGVKDAVTRIADAKVVDADMVAAAQEELRLSKLQRDALETQLNDLQLTDDGAIEVQLADLRRQLAEQQTRLAAETAVANQFAQKIEADAKAAEEAQRQLKELADSRTKTEELQQSLRTALEEEARLKAILDKTRVTPAPPPKIVTLPDPRPAPEGAREVSFLCANNRVYPIAADDWRESVRQAAEAVVASQRLNGGPAVGVNEEKFQKEFKRVSRRLTDDFFEVEIFAAGIYPQLRFTPKEKEGATESEVLKPRSRFQKLVAALDRNKYYARFRVLPDSYEVYLAARAVVDQAGILSGWEPMDAGWQYTTYLGGSILFGPTPPPDPNAKPAPPAKPQNVID